MEKSRSIDMHFKRSAIWKEIFFFVWKNCQNLKPKTFNMENLKEIYWYFDLRIRNPVPTWNTQVQGLQVPNNTVTMIILEILLVMDKINKYFT